MIVVADSGSTSTNWAVIENSEHIFWFNTKGFHPFFTNKDEMDTELQNNFPKDLNCRDIQQVFFYGAGCSSNEKCLFIKDELRQFFKNAQIEVKDDLIAAARALFYEEKGIALILGTGSNTGFYDGEKIVHKTQSLGFILGDEGSGAHLGKMLLTNFLHNELPIEIENILIKEYHLTKDAILKAVYGERQPNRYLASFTRFIDQNCEHPYIDKLIEKSFTALFEKHICTYKNYQNLSIRATGSVAYVFEKQLKKLATKYQTNIDLILKEPIKRLAQFHRNKSLG